MKKVLVGIALIVIIFSSVIYNRLQQPTDNDIFRITKTWTPSIIEEVILIREIEDKWLTIFRNQNSVMIAELQQNWIGTWQFRTGITLSSSYYPPSAENQITWQASEREEKITYYFGVVMDPKIARLEVETRDGLFEELPFIETEEYRFFFKGVEDESLLLPVNINGFSISGKLIYSSLRKLSDS